VKIEQIELSKIKKNPDNPRVIKDDKFKKLVKSIQTFPQMLEIRPIVVNSDYTILGGNQRYEACKSAKLETVPIIYADNLTPEQEREFIIKDNSNFGDWDFDILANEWESDLLLDWGLDLPILTSIEGEDGSQQYEQEQIKQLKVSFSNQEDYDIVVNFLNGISNDYSAALIELSKNGATNGR
jgi:ParB-like chromosome segregation protein Spo0J